jgi:hypothetical protein
MTAFAVTAALSCHRRAKKTRRTLSGVRGCSYTTRLQQFEDESGRSLLVCFPFAWVLLLNFMDEGERR